MKTSSLFIVLLFIAGIATAQIGKNGDTPVSEFDSLNLPEPYATKSKMNFSNVIGWSAGNKPIAPVGFKVTAFASGLVSPRWMYVTPNGDVLVALANTELKGLKKVGADLIGVDKAQRISKSPNQILLFRDADKDGVPEQKERFLEGIYQPFGMLVLGDFFYIAGTGGLWRYPYQAGQLHITGEAQLIAALPVGGYNNHWTRNIIASPDKSKIYISVGSGSNVGEHGLDNEIRRACILEINPDGTGEKIYASGLRNPVGMGWAPGTNTLWTAVNERDELGDDLVPDYLTSVKRDGFYGWPYSYFGQHEDPRRKGERPDLVSQALVPDVSLGPHTASLGLAFYEKTAFPEKYLNGAFIAQHGSWNRSEIVGYKVVFVPFTTGKPSGPPEDFLTGFVSDICKSEVFGRPVGVVVLPDGAMLVTDDSSGMIWHIQATK